MTDEARIARLTELARRVWPDAAAAMVDGVASVVEIPGYYECLYIARHPRALDALEAALLVLAAEERVPLTERRVLEDRIAALERDRSTLVRRYQGLEREQAAWVEKLAAVWEESAQYVEDFSNEPPARGVARQLDTLRRCARELRERAKGEPCE